MEFIKYSHHKQHKKVLFFSFCYKMYTAQRQMLPTKTLSHIFKIVIKNICHGVQEDVMLHTLCISCSTVVWREKHNWNLVSVVITNICLQGQPKYATGATCFAVQDISVWWDLWDLVSAVITNICFTGTTYACHSSHLFCRTRHTSVWWVSYHNHHKSALTWCRKHNWCKKKNRKQKEKRTNKTKIIGFFLSSTKRRSP